MSKAMHAVTLGGFNNLRVNLMLDANRCRVETGALYLGVMNSLGENDIAEPFFLTADGLLDIGPEGTSSWRLSFPSGPLEPGARVTVSTVAAGVVSEVMSVVVADLEPVAPPGGKVARVICKCLEPDEDGDTPYGLNFELVLDEQGRRVPGSIGFGWEGLVAEMDERWPFIITQNSDMDFGIHTGNEYTRIRQLGFPEGPIRPGDTIRMNEDGAVSAYRIQMVREI